MNLIKATAAQFAEVLKDACALGARDHVCGTRTRQPRTVAVILGVGLCRTAHVRAIGQAYRAGRFHAASTEIS